MSIEQIKNDLEDANFFVSNFIANITGDSMNDAAKQAYFLDNQAEVKRVLGFLNNVKSVYETAVVNDICSEEEKSTYELTDTLITTLGETLSNYRESLKINPNITKEETTVVVNEETVKHAMEEDSSTKKMVENMQTLATQKTDNGEYNYMIVVSKTQPYYVSVDTPEQLIGVVNRMADSIPGATIEVFEIKYAPVPLKTTTKTVYTL